MTDELAGQSKQNPPSTSQQMAGALNCQISFTKTRTASQHFSLKSKHLDCCKSVHIKLRSIGFPYKEAQLLYVNIKCEKKWSEQMMGHFKDALWFWSSATFSASLLAITQLFNTCLPGSKDHPNGITICKKMWVKKIFQLHRSSEIPEFYSRSSA